MANAGVNLRTADLHTHSTCSDGLHAPADVVSAVAGRGVRVMALTDHDTIRGLPEASEAAKRVGLELVPGIEISTVHDGEDIHILGYFIGSNAELDDYVNMMSQRRSERLHQIAGRLRQVGVEIDIQGVQSYADGLVTRSHIARYLVEAGIAASVGDAFAEYLGPGRAGHVPSGVVTPVDAIGIIHRAGGCASLAHPGEWTRLSVIDALVDAGLDAIEVVHPSHDDRLTNYYGQIVEKKGLLRTGGSDMHAVHPELGEYVIPAEDVERLRVRAMAG